MCSVNRNGIEDRSTAVFPWICGQVWSKWTFWKLQLHHCESCHFMWQSVSVISQMACVADSYINVSVFLLFSQWRVNQRGYDLRSSDCLIHTPSITFRHLPPNSARFGYATDGALFISVQLSTNTVSALRKVRVLIRLWKQTSAQAPT